MNCLLMIDYELVDDMIDEEVYVDVHHLNYLLLYHQVQERLVFFLMVVLLFVEKNQAKKIKIKEFKIKNILATVSQKKIMDWRIFAITQERKELES